MAVVENGYAYFDYSANIRYTAGQTMPTPGVNDEYFGVTSTGATDYSKLYYVYAAERAVTYSYYSTEIAESSFTIPEGWGVTSANYTMTNASVVSAIAGKNVVSVNLANNSVSKITSINIPSTIVAFWAWSNPVLQHVTGTLSSSLKYIIFKDASSLVSVPDMSNAINMINGQRMFQNCTLLTTVPSLPPNIIYLSRAFDNCSSLENAPTIPSTVRDLGYTFQGCSSLTTAPINNSTVVVYINHTFKDCVNLVDASNFNISISMKVGTCTFQNCTKLNNPPIIRGTHASISYMFSHCLSLEYPPIFEGSFDNVANCFDYCESLIEPAVFPSDTLSMMGVYRFCSSLLHTGVIPSKATTISGMFRECTALTTVNLMIPNTVTNTDYLFYGCINLTGIIWRQGALSWPAGVDMFYNTQRDIIIYSDPNMSSGISSWVNSANNNNVYIGLNPLYTESSIVRSNLDGTLDDNSNYVKLTIKFKYPLIDDCKIYVPKIYEKNNQQQPIQDWTLTYTNSIGDTITKVITNSTDIEATRIEANDLIRVGTFETFFETTAEEGSVYIVVIPTSCNKVPRSYDNNGNYVYETYYWNSTAGQAIFTGDTYIFDALPDGSSFKIGGPIVEDEGETGFIVGNQVSLIEAQYPSTFNGPATFNGSSTFNDNLYIDIDENASTGTTDGDLYNLIVNILRWNDVFD